jgi:hypothetical protein
MIEGNLADLIDGQIDSQGVSIIRCDDSYTLTFTTATLEMLLERSREVGRVMLLVKHGAES